MTLFYLPDFKPTQMWNAKNVYVSAVVAAANFQQKETKVCRFQSEI